MRTRVLIAAWLAFGAAKAQESANPLGSDLGHQSLRIVNQQSAAGPGEGHLEFFIQHRFGDIAQGGYNAFGFDQSQIRLGIDCGISQRLTAGIARSSWGKTSNAYAKFQLVGVSESSRWDLTWLSDVSVNGEQSNVWGLNPFYPSHRLRFVHQLILGREWAPRFYAGIVPGVVHINLVETANDPNDIATLGAYARFSVKPKMNVTWEAQNSLAIGTSKALTSPPMAFGIEFLEGLHIFQLSLGNALSMNEAYIVTSDQGAWDASHLRLGFNIVRRW
ncbi:MAG: hypothetical protein RL577_190 [Bacteroidota bacterium]